MSNKNKFIVRSYPFNVKSVKPNKNGNYRIPRKMKKEIKRHRKQFFVVHEKMFLPTDSFCGTAVLLVESLIDFLSNGKQNPQIQNV